jgi:hypothetical protein
MSLRQIKYRLTICLALAVLVLGGCVAKVREPLRMCPGKESTAEALSALRARSHNAVPLKANGNCVLRYHNEGGKLKKNRFPVKLWLNPPDEIYMQGDVAFDPKAIILGLNEQEFWLTIRLNDISSYWWGKCGDENYSEVLTISPEVVLESLGIPNISAGDSYAENWSLSEEGVFDVLTLCNDDGHVVQKLYIYCCDYLVRKIEFFDIYGQVTVIAEMGEYEQVSDGFYMPAEVNIIRLESEDVQDSLKITLRSIRTVDFTENQRNRLFTRPEPRGFRHVYKISGGDIVEIVR